MTTYIKTITDRLGNLILPRTRTDAVTNTDGSRLSDTIASLITQVGAKSIAMTTITSASGNKTLALTDVGTMIVCNSASQILITVPPNSSVAFPIGSEIVLTRNGTGAVTVVPGSGVTVNSEGSKKSIANQYNGATLKKIATDEWLLLGALV